MIAIYDPVPKNHLSRLEKYKMPYISKVIQNDIIFTIAQMIRREIVQEVNNAGMTT